MKKRNRGFTLVEMVVTVSIFAILLGVLVPSLNSILGFRVQRAANSIGAALDRTKMEAMSRLIGEMKLEKRSDGYYISYYLHRGKASGEIRAEDEERIAPAGIRISYTLDNGISVLFTEGDSMILTFNRDTGSFRRIQTAEMTAEEVTDALDHHTDIAFHDGSGFCTSIAIQGGFRTRILTLVPETGSYEIISG